jgi:hypothetical protein
MVLENRVKADHCHRFGRKQLSEPSTSCGTVWATQPGHSIWKAAADDHSDRAASQG